MDSKTRVSVILNSTLQSHDVHRLLVNLHKVRVSATTLEGSIIFPSSNVTFLLVDVNGLIVNDDITVNQLSETLYKRIDKLMKLHRNCYVLIQSTSFENIIVSELFAALQNRYLFSRLKLVPIHNARQAVQSMQDIANISSKSISVSLLASLQRVIDCQTSSEQCQHIALRSIGLSDHECLVLMDGCGCLADIASATEDALLDCSLSTQSALSVITFLHSPPVRPSTD